MLTLVCGLCLLLCGCLAPVACFSALKAGRGPTLVLEPPAVMEFSSETGAVLPCSAQGQPLPIVRWEKKDGSPASPVSKIRSI